MHVLNLYVEKLVLANFSPHRAFRYEETYVAPKHLVP
jgi:hypothetical protein